MDEKQVKQLVDDVNNGVAGLKKEIEAKGASITSLEQKAAELAAKLEFIPKKEYVENMQAQLDGLEGKIKEIKMSGPQGRETIETQLIKQFTSDEFKNLITMKKSGGLAGRDFNLSVKANEITTSGSMTSSTGTLIIGQETEPLVTHVPWRNTPLWNAIAKGTVGQNNNSVGWVERTSITDGTAMTAENAKFGQSYAAFQKYKVDVKKITDYIKITREDMEDTDYIISEVMDLLNNLIPRKRENQLLSGDGIGDNILGILSYAKAFAVPTGTEVPTAVITNYDVLKVAATQVMLGDTSLAYAQGYMPNMVLMNPVDIQNMHLAKDTIGQYVLPPFTAANGMEVAGMRVTPDIDITAGAFLVGDFNYAKAFVKRDLQIRMWEQNESDPLYDLVTFTGSQRLAFRVKNIEKFAFSYGTFAAAKAALGA